MPNAPKTTDRIFFTSWQFISQGGFTYTNAKGELLAPWSESDAGARFQANVPRGIRLRACKAQRMRIPEGQHAPLLFHDGKYKAWYTIVPEKDTSELPKGHNHYLCYAESADGNHWTRPSLGIFEYQGSRDNNIVFRGDTNGSIRGLHGQGVFLDPAGDPQERFKMVYLGACTPDELQAYREKWPDDIDPMAIRPDGYAWGLCGAVSPDGIHWKTLPEPLLIQHADTMNCAYFDRRLGKYVAYYRNWQLDWSQPAAREMCGTIGRRAIGRAFSSDFRHYHCARTVVAPGADMQPQHVWYGPGKTTLPNCPDQHVLLPYKWKLENDSMDIHLLSSPDGLVYTEAPGGPVVTTGAPGEWDGGYVVTDGNLLEIGDQWRLPYKGYPIPHKYPRLDADRRELYTGVREGQGYACWPKGRLVALECPAEGQFWTIPVAPGGSRIRINATVPATGCIRIGLTGKGDLPGRSVADCDPITGADGFELPVTWRGEKTFDIPEEPISLTVELREAQLFGIEFY